MQTGIGWLTLQIALDVNLLVTINLIVTYLWEIRKVFSPDEHHGVLQSCKTVPIQRAFSQDPRHFCNSITDKTLPGLFDEIALPCHWAAGSGAWCKHVGYPCLRHASGTEPGIHVLDPFVSVEYGTGMYLRRITAMRHYKQPGLSLQETLTLAEIGS